MDLFQRMMDGEFPDGARNMRAKVDMKSTNVGGVIRCSTAFARVSLLQTGVKWCNYPLFDFVNCVRDFIEALLFICTLEFVVHRTILDWFLDCYFASPLPHQDEFASLN
jgi:glutaminyl-tRNA synthetase